MVPYRGTAALAPAVQLPHLAAVGPTTAATAAGDLEDWPPAVEAGRKHDLSADTSATRARHKAW